MRIPSTYRLGESEENYPLIGAGADPAAGVEAVLTVPGDSLWAIHSVLATLVTDATVASRRATLVIDDGTTPFLELQSGTDHVASTTRVYSTWPGGGSGAGAQLDHITWPCPGPLLLPGGFRVRTVTTNLQAGDDWGRLRMYVEESPARGLAAQIAYNLREIMREEGALSTFETERG